MRRLADILFPTERVVVFIDGCFWHSCPQHATTPRANRAWWVEKLAANRRRDRDTDERLAEAGWTILRFWEHGDPIEVANQIRALVLSKRK